MARLKPCRWSCGRKTNRVCGICLDCCNARDDRDKRISAGEVPYVPPTERPGHRFYKRKQLSAAQQAALDRASHARNGEIPRPNAPGGLLENDQGNTATLPLIE